MSLDRIRAALAEGDGAKAMRVVFDEVGARQPVGWGGSGHVGVKGEDLSTLLDARVVDFATVHVYPFHTHPRLLRISDWRERGARAGDVAEGIIRDRAALCRAYAVPLLMEEFGWKTGAHTHPPERALVMRRMLDTARFEAVGTLPWMIAERGRPDYDGLLIRPEHTEIFSLLRAH